MSSHSLVRLVFGEIEASEGFAGWLAEVGCSVALTNGNRLFLVGLRPDGSLGVTEREYPGAGALAADGADALFLTTRYQIWRLQDALPPGSRTEDGHDRLFVPQTAWTTGRLEVRGLASDGRGGVVFANSRFSCLATLDERLNFAPRWLPPFVTALAPEDRCRLTGVALDDGGLPAYATCAARTDTPGGWRQHRLDGGVVLGVPEGEVVTDGLSMPHSPVLRGDRLWLTNAGAGELGVVDIRTGSYEPVAAVPGFARGLAMVDGYAVVGVSKPARGETFTGLPLATRLPLASARCGAVIVEVGSGRVVHRLLVHGVAPEVDDLALLPGTRWPTAVGFQGDDVQEWVTFPC